MRLVLEFPFTGFDDLLYANSFGIVKTILDVNLGTLYEALGDILWEKNGVYRATIYLKKVCISFYTISVAPRITTGSAMLSKNDTNE